MTRAPPQGSPKRERGESAHHPNPLRGAASVTTRLPIARAPGFLSVTKRTRVSGTAASRYSSHQLPVASTYAPRARFVAAWARMQSIGLRVAEAMPLTMANHPTAATASLGWLPAA